jgi:hypothetical protein
VPIVGETAGTKPNNTINIGTSTTVQIPGGTIHPFSLNYVYRGAGIWSTSVGGQSTLQHDGSRWVAKYFDPLNGTFPQLWATGGPEADPSTLSFIHAGSPYNYSNTNGTWYCSATSGSFAGITGTFASYIGQPYHATTADEWYRWNGTAWQGDASSITQFNIDGGTPGSVFGGTIGIDGGTP